MADDTRSFEPTDSAGGVPVYTGSGEKSWMLVSMTVRNNCSKPSEIWSTQEGGRLREGSRTIPAGQALEIRDWAMPGTQTIYLFCNGDAGEDGCAVENLSVYYSDDHPGEY
jgi:hypothetical protein